MLPGLRLCDSKYVSLSCYGLHDFNRGCPKEYLDERAQMRTCSALNEMSQDDLLESLDRNKKKAVQGLLDDVDVHFVVVMQSPDGGRRNLLTVGPNLEYTELASLEGLELDGMHAVAFVKATRKRSGKNTLFRTRSMERAESLETQVGELRLENSRLLDEVSKALRTAELVGQERILLKSKEDRLSRQHSEQAELQGQLDERESELVKMEEELMDRMHAMVQKEAELQQWEENMFARERKLAERLKQAGLDDLEMSASR